MSESDRALEIVQLAVQALSHRNAKVCASASALASLASTSGGTLRVAVSTPQEPSRQQTRGPELPTPSPAPVAKNLAAMFAEVTGATAPAPVAEESASLLPVRTSRAIAIAQPSAVAPAAGSKAERLGVMRAAVLPCALCPNLVRSRTQVVFGVGNPEAELMFVGEAPGADEDLAGEPFVGKAGQLLTKIIETMGFARSDVYIANVLKCRPDMPAGSSGNRKPTLAEMNTCKPYLLEQISIIQPRVLVGLGATAMEGLLGVDKFGITKKRGEWHEFAGTPLMPTFHPAYLLRNQALSEKRRVWEDMLAVLEKLGRPITQKQRDYFLSR
jgi:DNA polymerase